MQQYATLRDMRVDWQYCRAACAASVILLQCWHACDAMQRSQPERLTELRRLLRLSPRRHNWHLVGIMQRAFLQQKRNELLHLTLIDWWIGVFILCVYYLCRHFVVLDKEPALIWLLPPNLQLLLLLLLLLLYLQLLLLMSLPLSPLLLLIPQPCQMAQMRLKESMTATGGGKGRTPTRGGVRWRLSGCAAIRALYHWWMWMHGKAVRRGSAHMTAC